MGFEICIPDLVWVCWRNWFPFLNSILLFGYSLCSRLAFLLFLIKTLDPFRLNPFFIAFQLQEARELEKPIPSKPQSPVIQAAAVSPKFNRLKQSQAQSKPTTPEKTDLTNGEHARSGSSVITENGHAPRERGPSLSGTAPVLPCPPVTGPSCIQGAGEGAVWCHDRKPPVALLFLGLPLDFPFDFLLWSTAQEAECLRSRCQLWVFWLCCFFFLVGGCSWNISSYCCLMSIVVPWVHCGVLVSQEVIVWVVEPLMSVSSPRRGRRHHLSLMHRLSVLYPLTGS